MVSLRIAEPLAQTSYSSGTALAGPTWNPIALTDFVSMATLFTEYRVRSLHFDVTFPPVTSATDWTTFAGVLDDPTSTISASTLTLAQASGVTLGSGLHQGGRLRHLCRPSRAQASTAIATLDGGWLPVTVAWPGRTLILTVSSNASSSALGHSYQGVWTIDFRIRV